MICANSQKINCDNNREIWNKSLKQKNMKINIDKTITLVLSYKDAKTTINLNNKSMNKTFKRHQRHYKKR